VNGRAMDPVALIGRVSRSCATKFLMTTSEALLLIDSLQTSLRDDLAQMETDFSSRKVMVLIHVLARNFDTCSELTHGLTHGRSFAAKGRPGLALSRLHSTLVNIQGPQYIRGDHRCL